MPNDFSNYNNTELKFKLAAIESEYEAKRNKAVSIIDEMKEVENRYLACKNELMKRTKGKNFI
jgi:hypothetical protein